LDRLAPVVFISQELMNLRTDLICINCLLDAAGNRNLIAKDTLMGAAGVGQEDGDDEGAGAGCWMLDSRCLFLVSGHCLPVTKCIGSKVEGKG
jgi:hypothetical protein